jgi:Zn-dependent protease with chaperone function
MTLAYTFRLVCLSLAAFFLVHLAVGMLVLAISPAAVRLVERIPARSAARWLLTLRLLPLASSLLAVAAFCIPSYLWLEPEATAEETSLVCLALALLGFSVWAFSIARGVRAAVRSLRYIDRCQRAGFGTRLKGDPSPVWVMEGATGALMLAGILRPRIFISRKVMTALSRDQLAVAVRHESAHRVSRDNLKRLLIVLSPGILPFFRGFDSLDTHWSRLTEWAADDHAVDGDSGRSLSLAAALVRVARLAPGPNHPPLITSLLDERRNLAARVDRLLRPASAINPPERRIPIVPAGATLVTTVLLVAVLLHPATFQNVHRLLELLIQ